MRKLFLFAVVALFALNVNAQRFGVRLGGNFAGMMSTLADVDGETNTIAPGMIAGILGEIGPNMVSVRVEVNYAQKGFNKETVTDLSTLGGSGILVADSKYNFDYIEIPVLLKVKPPTMPLYFYAGPYFGIGLNGEIVSDFTLDGNEIDAASVGKPETYDLYKEPTIFKENDFGAALGLGTQFGIGPLHAFAEGRATLGLSNLYDTESDAYKALVTTGAYKDDDALKNMTFTVAVGIVFGN